MDEIDASYFTMDKTDTSYFSMDEIDASFLSMDDKGASDWSKWMMDSPSHSQRRGIHLEASEQRVSSGPQARAASC